MTGAVILLQVAACLLVVTAGGGMLLQRNNKRLDRMAARCRAVRERRTRSARDRAGRAGPSPGKLVAGFGGRIIRSGLLSDRTLKTLRATLAAAGLRAESALGLFVGSKLLLLVLLPALVWFAGTRVDMGPMLRNLLVASAAAVGLLLPDMVVKRIRSNTLKRVGRGLPDALDMLIICTEAGMAIEASIQRVSQELRFAHAATADELALTSTELQLTADPQAAFANMGARTGLEALRRLGVTVVQTIEYGSPLSQALRLLAVELRAEMINVYEERAARLPVLLTVPMIIFILPALFLIIAGPAAIQVFALQHF